MSIGSCGSNGSPKIYCRFMLRPSVLMDPNHYNNREYLLKVISPL